MSKDREFFIGWESECPRSVRNLLKRRIALVFILVLAISILTAAYQQTPGSGRFAFGDVTTQLGILLSDPIPLLVTEEDVEGHRLLHLVRPFKQGIDKADISEFHLKLVSVEGTLIHNDGGAMIEIVPDGISDLGESESRVPTVSSQIDVTLQGEIVDSKCYLGMMNPGRYKPHRACAIQCLRGGIPPILVVESRDGAFAQYVLVGPNGESINHSILDYVAEPVELSGKLWTIGDRRVVFVDLTTISRL